MKCACCGIELAQNPGIARREEGSYEAYFVCGVLGAAWHENTSVIIACLERQRLNIKARGITESGFDLPSTVPTL